MLLVGSWAGVYRVVDQHAPKLVALPGQVITHLSATSSGVAAAAVPTLGPVHKMYTSETSAAQQASGLHLLRPSDAPEGPAHTAQHVWSGDARSCHIWDVAAASSAASTVGLAVGTEPADVFCSLDGGSSWSDGTNSFAAAASRPSWSFPAPPHEPHVLSIEALPAADGQQPQLVVGVEVGGVLVSSDAAAAGTSGNGGGTWEERNEALYVDIHSCRIDPHDPSHWLAVTDVWQGRYTVGLAFGQRKGEVLIAAGDKPPAIGVHLYRSTDGGNSWAEITDTVFSTPECAKAKGSRTPVPFFHGSQALVGTDGGHLLASDDPGRQQWRLMCRLPHPVTCMVAPGQSCSSVMH
ncbi:hypothetical protein ACK3TF_005276 [Chlorella vulgaris]